MPRYFFHVFDHHGELRDGEGVELSDSTAADGFAIEAARSLICADVMSGQIGLEGRIDIAGPDGQTLGSVTYREAVGLPERMED